MKQSSAQLAKKLPHIVRNAKVRYRVLKSPHQVSILSEFKQSPHNSLHIQNINQE